MTVRLVLSRLRLEFLICGVTSLVWAILGLLLAIQLPDPGQGAMPESLGQIVMYWRLGFLALPIMSAVVLASSLIAGDLEAGSVTFAWSVVLSRARWLLETTAIGLLALVTLLLPMCLSAHLIGTGLSASSDANLAPGQLDLSVILVVGRSLLVFAVVCLAGTMIGRTVPTLLVGAMAGLVLLAVVELAFLGLRDGRLTAVDPSTPGALAVRTGVATLDGHILGESEARVVLQGGPDLAKNYQLITLGLSPSARAQLVMQQLAVMVAGSLVTVGIASRLVETKSPKS